MSKLMLIDAAHQEELRVVVLNGNYIEDSDYQTKHKKTTKGNIYLAKVTRVEPSLQAAFVEYGSQRHGFLPFSEIHPNYYQIPAADKDKLLDEMRNVRSKIVDQISTRGVVTASDDEGQEENSQPMFSDDDDMDERPNFSNRYKIQEVIKKDQVILVQIEKEERGNKGASLTTYISLPGRYCVYMPNSTKGGGVSRKIMDDEDRNRLKKVAVELTNECENNGSVIIRTAGSYKTKTEIKRDFAYLQKLWENICDHTMQSKAPEFIYEEGDVIKKSIRDLYDADLEQIVVAGEQGFNDAQEFMKMILPRHVNKVKLHKDKTPLFYKYGVEELLAELHSTQISLQSGGYLVINQTEALVAIDVNSGRATGERNVEATALKTNLEAVNEIARQVRLRDLAGLIVVDFIDMDELRNKKSVERAMKEALSFDKAKVHVGRISQFGLLEMSRQRLKNNIIESYSHTCDHCNGRGRVRAVESTTIVVLRAIENEISYGNINELRISGGSALMLHILNNKRKEIAALEESFGGRIVFYNDETGGADGFFIERIKGRNQNVSTEKEALSTIDSPTSEEIPEDQWGDENVEMNQSSGRKKHRRDRRDRFKKNRNSGSEFKSEDSQEEPNYIKESFHQDSEEVAQPESFESDDRKGSRQKFKKPRFNKKQRRGDDFNKVAAPVFSDDDGVSDNFDEEMAARRKQNQSLLKEIWKKIVD